MYVPAAAAGLGVAAAETGSKRNRRQKANQNGLPFLQKEGCKPGPGDDEV